MTVLPVAEFSTVVQTAAKPYNLGGFVSRDFIQSGLAGLKIEADNGQLIQSLKDARILRSSSTITSLDQLKQGDINMTVSQRRWDLAVMRLSLLKPENQINQDLLLTEKGHGLSLANGLDALGEKAKTLGRYFYLCTALSIESSLGLHRGNAKLDAVAAMDLRELCELGRKLGLQKANTFALAGDENLMDGLDMVRSEADKKLIVDMMKLVDDFKKNKYQGNSVLWDEIERIRQQVLADQAGQTDELTGKLAELLELSRKARGGGKIERAQLMMALDKLMGEWLELEPEVNSKNLALRARLSQIFTVANLAFIVYLAAQPGYQIIDRAAWWGIFGAMFNYSIQSFFFMGLIADTQKEKPRRFYTGAIEEKDKPTTITYRYTNTGFPSLAALVQDLYVDLETGNSNVNINNDASGVHYWSVYGDFKTVRKYEAQKAVIAKIMAQTGFIANPKDIQRLSLALALEDRKSPAQTIIMSILGESGVDMRQIVRYGWKAGPRGGEYVGYTALKRVIKERVAGRISDRAQLELLNRLAEDDAGLMSIMDRLTLDTILEPEDLEREISILAEELGLAQPTLAILNQEVKDNIETYAKEEVVNALTFEVTYQGVFKTRSKFGGLPRNKAVQIAERYFAAIKTEHNYSQLADKAMRLRHGVMDLKGNNPQDMEAAKALAKIIASESGISQQQAWKIIEAINRAKICQEARGLNQEYQVPVEVFARARDYVKVILFLERNDPRVHEEGALREIKQYLPRDCDLAKLIERLDSGDYYADGKGCFNSDGRFAEKLSMFFQDPCSANIDPTTSNEIAKKIVDYLGQNYLYGAKYIDKIKTIKAAKAKAGLVIDDEAADALYWEEYLKEINGQVEKLLKENMIQPRHWQVIQGFVAEEMKLQRGWVNRTAQGLVAMLAEDINGLDIIMGELKGPAGQQPWIQEAKKQGAKIVKLQTEAQKNDRQKAQERDKLAKALGLGPAEINNLEALITDLIEKGIGEQRTLARFQDADYLSFQQLQEQIVEILFGRDSDLHVEMPDNNYRGDHGHYQDWQIAKSDVPSKGALIDLKRYGAILKLLQSAASDPVKKYQIEDGLRQWIGQQQEEYRIKFALADIMRLLAHQPRAEELRIMDEIKKINSAPDDQISQKQKLVASRSLQSQLANRTLIKESTMMPLAKEFYEAMLKAVAGGGLAAIIDEFGTDRRRKVLTAMLEKESKAYGIGQATKYQIQFSTKIAGPELPETVQEFIKNNRGKYASSVDGKFFVLTVKGVMEASERDQLLALFDEAKAKAAIQTLFDRSQANQALAGKNLLLGEASGIVADLLAAAAKGQLRQHQATRFYIGEEAVAADPRRAINLKTIFFFDRMNREKWRGSKAGNTDSGAGTYDGEVVGVKLWGLIEDWLLDHKDNGVRIPIEFLSRIDNEFLEKIDFGRGSFNRDEKIKIDKDIYAYALARKLVELLNDSTGRMSASQAVKELIKSWNLTVVQRKLVTAELEKALVDIALEMKVRLKAAEVAGLTGALDELKKQQEAQASGGSYLIPMGGPDADRYLTKVRDIYGQQPDFSSTSKLLAYLWQTYQTDADGDHLTAELTKFAKQQWGKLRKNQAILARIAATRQVNLDENESERVAELASLAGLAGPDKQMAEEQINKKYDLKAQNIVSRYEARSDNEKLIRLPWYLVPTGWQPQARANQLKQALSDRWETKRDELIVARPRTAEEIAGFMVSNSRMPLKKLEDGFLNDYGQVMLEVSRIIDGMAKSGEISATLTAEEIAEKVSEKLRVLEKDRGEKDGGARGLVDYLDHRRFERPVEQTMDVVRDLDCDNFLLPLAQKKSNAEYRKKNGRLIRSHVAALQTGQYYPDYQDRLIGAQTAMASCYVICMGPDYDTRGRQTIAGCYVEKLRKAFAEIREYVEIPQKVLKDHVYINKYLGLDDMGAAKGPQYKRMNFYKYAKLIGLGALGLTVLATGGSAMFSLPALIGIGALSVGGTVLDRVLNKHPRSILFDLTAGAVVGGLAVTVGASLLAGYWLPLLVGLAGGSLLGTLGGSLFKSKLLSGRYGRLASVITWGLAGAPSGWILGTWLAALAGAAPLALFLAGLGGAAVGVIALNALYNNKGQNSADRKWNSYLAMGGVTTMSSWLSGAIIGASWGAAPMMFGLVLMISALAAYSNASELRYLPWRFSIDTRKKIVRWFGLKGKNDWLRQSIYDWLMERQPLARAFKEEQSYDLPCDTEDFATGLYCFLKNYLIRQHQSISGSSSAATDIRTLVGQRNRWDGGMLSKIKQIFGRYLSDRQAMTERDWWRHFNLALGITGAGSRKLLNLNLFSFLFAGVTAMKFGTTEVLNKLLFIGIPLSFANFQLFRDAFYKTLYRAGIDVEMVRDMFAVLEFQSQERVYQMARRLGFNELPPFAVTKPSPVSTAFYGLHDWIYELYGQTEEIKKPDHDNFTDNLVNAQFKDKRNYRLAIGLFAAVVVYGVLAGQLRTFWLIPLLYWLLRTEGLVNRGKEIINAGALNQGSLGAYDKFVTSPGKEIDKLDKRWAELTGALEEYQEGIPEEGRAARLQKFEQRLQRLNELQKRLMKETEAKFKLIITLGPAATETEKEAYNKSMAALLRTAAEIAKTAGAIQQIKEPKDGAVLAQEIKAVEKELTKKLETLDVAEAVIDEYTRQKAGQRARSLRTGYDRSYAGKKKGVSKVAFFGQ